MPQRVDLFDLETLQLRPGEGQRVDADVRVDPLQLGGERYSLAGGAVPARLDVSRTVAGYALRLRFDALLEGPCVRCVGPASPTITVDAREIEQPGEDDDLHSPYLDQSVLDLADWARDALVLAMPAQIVCSRRLPGPVPGMWGEPERGRSRAAPPRGRR